MAIYGVTEKTVPPFETPPLLAVLLGASIGQEWRYSPAFQYSPMSSPAHSGWRISPRGANSRI